MGNVFGIRSEILKRYNIQTPSAVVSASALFGAMDGLACLTARLGDQGDFKLMKAEIACKKLLRFKTDSKIQWVAKHIIFRLSLILNGVSQLSGHLVLVPLTGLFTIPLAIYHQGKSELNKNAFLMTKMPVLIHMVCLTLRMLINPNQFVKLSALEQANDPHVLSNTWGVANAFWEDPLEIKM